MAPRPNPNLVLLGPSGSGKSTLAGWLQHDLGFLHIEVDRFPEGNGIDLAGIRAEWDTFWNQFHPEPLCTAISARVRAERRQGAVLSFPSDVVLSHQHLMAAEGADIRVVVMYGTRRECVDAFLRRERELRRGLTVEHWLRYNTQAHAEFSVPSYSRYRLAAFQDGQFRDRATLVKEVNQRVGWEARGAGDGDRSCHDRRA